MSRSPFLAVRSSGLLALATLLAGPLAAQIVVPTDAPDLATAVALAQAGDRILVRTEVPQAPVVLDKPVSIVGEPRARIEVPCGQHAGVLLAGPGTGVVTLSNVDVVLGAECAFPDAGVAGGGFRELYLDGCRVDARWSAFGGVTYGTSAISVSVPLLTLHESQVYGGSVDADVCIGPLPGGGHPAIFAPGTDVVAVTSTIRGGDGGYLCCEFCTCPTDTDGWGGDGAPGAIVRHLHLVDGEIGGGTGSSVVAYPSFEQLGGGDPCGTQTFGLPFLALSSRYRTASLHASGPLVVGEPWSLRWTAGGDAGWVIGGTRRAVPWELGGPTGQGTVYLDPTSLFLLRLEAVESGQGELILPIPPVLDLVGRSVGFQVLDVQDGLTTPVLRVARL